jgi:hypothetical protein
VFRINKRHAADARREEFGLKQHGKIPLGKRFLSRKGNVNYPA